MSPRWRFTTLHIASALLGLTSAAGAQEIPVIAQQANAPAADALSAQESNSGVYVRDSAVALDKMALAQRMERAHEWGKSAEIYQEILDKYPDRVVPSHTDAHGVADQYTSVIRDVVDHLRRWPADGLNIYRARYEVAAQNLLKSAKGDDLEPLHQVFTRYFATRSGEEAGFDLMSADFELGEFAAASWIGEQLLLHPDLGNRRPEVLFRLGLAAHLSGDDSRASSALAEINGKFPDALGSVRGVDVKWGEELARDLASVHASDFASNNDAWRMPGGDMSRSKIAAASARPGARLYAVPLAQPSWKGVTDPSQRNMLISQDQASRADGAALGVMPVIDGSELFFQDNARVYAVNVDSGLPLPGWLATYPAHQGAYVLENAWPMPTGHQLSLTLTDAFVVGVMNQPDPLASMNNLASERDMRLVCLDRKTGKEVWTLLCRDLPNTDLKNFSLGGSPLVIGDNLYLTARVSKTNEYQDVYVVCFNLQTGAYRWSCYVASAANAQSVMNNNGQLVMGDVSTHLSYANGHLFIATNLGAVAALDAYGGTIDWLSIYRQADEAVNPNAIMGMGMGFGGNNGIPTPPTSSAAGPWTQNAPMVVGEHLFVLPSDGKSLLIYDTGTGRIVKRLNKDDCCRTSTDGGPGVADMHLARPNTLLAVLPQGTINDLHGKPMPELLILATPDRICAIDWQQYDPEHPQQSIVWDSKPYRLDQPTDTIRGRAFVSGDSIYLSAAWALCRVAMRNGEIMETYPPGNGAWSGDEGPGNVLLSGEHLIIAGDRHVNVYTDLTLARAKLDREQSDKPNEPAVRLRYAEVMFAAGENGLAMQKLDEAINLVGGMQSMQLGAPRQRIFADALGFAVKLSRLPGPAANINALFDRAQAAATSPSEQVDYRMSRARFARFGAEQDLALAVKLYQQILADDTLRTAPVEDVADVNDARAGDSAGGVDDALTQAGVAAQAQIASIIGQGPKGRDAYAPYAQEARNRYDAAASAQNPTALLDLSRQYPNAEIVPGALASAAELFEAANQPRLATQVLRQVYLRLGRDNVRGRAQVLESLARNEVKLDDQTEAASSRLMQAGAMVPDGKLSKPLLLADGTTFKDMTLTQAALALAHLNNTSRLVSLPDFHLPTSAQIEARKKLPAKVRKVVALAPEDKAALVEHVGMIVPGRQESARADRVVTWTGGVGVQVYAVGNSTALATMSDCVEAPLGYAWINNRATLLVWTSTTLMAFAADQPQPLWKADLSALPRLDVAVHEAAPTISAPPPPQQQTNQSSQIMDRSGPQGDTDRDASAAIASKPEAITRVLPLGDVIVLATSASRIGAVRATDGGVLWQTRLANHGAQQVLASDDFVVAHIVDESTARLDVLDTYTGQLLAQRSFAADAAQAPINIALSADGIMAYTLPDRIVLHNLYDIGQDSTLQTPTLQTMPSGDSPQLFAEMNHDDQLLIRGGQVLALCDGGKFLRGYSTETGLQREYPSDNSHEAKLIPMNLFTNSDSPDISLRVQENYVYVWSSKSIAAYNLDKPNLNWRHTVDNLAQATQQMFIGKDYVVTINTPTPKFDPASDRPVSPPKGFIAPSCRIDGFSRALVPTGDHAESGLWVHTVQFNDPRGIVSWQGVEGGLYYLAQDQRLHFLPGNAAAYAENGTTQAGN